MKRLWLGVRPKFRNDDGSGEATPEGRKRIIAEHMRWLNAGRPGFEVHATAFEIQAFLDRTTYRDRALMSNRGLVTARNKFNEQNLKQNRGDK